MSLWSIILPVLATLLGAGVSVGGSYLAARRQQNLGIRHELYRHDLPELGARIRSALTQVSAPSECPFVTRDIVVVVNQMARKAATGSRWDRGFAGRLHELAQWVEREHGRLVQQYGNDWAQGVPQVYEGGYFQEARELLTEAESWVGTLDGELQTRI